MKNSKTDQNGHSSLILLVDDNVQLQSVLKIGMEMYGFRTITASDGIDALEQYRARSGDFNAIVTDNEMPHMNGLEFVRSVREIGFTGPIVVISGLLKTADLRTYQQYGINGFVRKPFAISMLATMLLPERCHQRMSPTLIHKGRALRRHSASSIPEI